MSSKHHKLAVGTAQFGMSYGIANTSGQIQLEEGKKIIHTAKINGINTLDTAIGYGDSETQLGKIGVQDWKIITKVLPLPDENTEAVKWINEGVHNSLKRLQVESLYAVLFHVPDQLLSNNGASLYKALHALKEQGLIKKIGVSVYTPEQLGHLFSTFDFDIVQAPYNILDRRIETSGWLAKLAARKVEVHIRSVFLQGLLLMPALKRPEKFNRWNRIWDEFDQWLFENELTPLQACLNFVLNNPLVDKAVVGVDGVENILDIIENANKETPLLPETISSMDLNLINPALW